MKRLLALALLALATLSSGQEVFVNDAGTLRQITGIFVNDAGTLREIEAIYVNDAGTLRQVYSSVSFAYALTDDTISISQPTGDVIAGFRLQNNGQAQSGTGVVSVSYSNVSSEWQLPLDATQAALYEVEAAQVSLSLGDGASTQGNGTVGVGSWQGLGTTRTWEVDQPEGVFQVSTWIIDFTIRDISTQTTVATARMTISATAT